MYRNTEDGIVQYQGKMLLLKKDPVNFEKNELPQMYTIYHEFLPNH